MQSDCCPNNALQNTDVQAYDIPAEKTTNVTMVFFSGHAERERRAKNNCGGSLSGAHDYMESDIDASIKSRMASKS